MFFGACIKVRLPSSGPLELKENIDIVPCSPHSCFAFGLPTGTVQKSGKMVLDPEATRRLFKLHPQQTPCPLFVESSQAFLEFLRNFGLVLPDLVAVVMGNYVSISAFRLGNLRLCLDHPQLARVSFGLLLEVEDGEVGMLDSLVRSLVRLQMLKERVAITAVD